MNFKNEKLMMSKEEAKKRAKELLNENQVDLITKYMFLEQQCKKQKEAIDKAINDISIILEIVREQPSGSDCWIINRLEANKKILQEVSE